MAPSSGPLLPLPDSARPSWARGEADPHRWDQSAWPPPPTPPQAVLQGVQQLHPQGWSETRSPQQLNGMGSSWGLWPCTARDGAERNVQPMTQTPPWVKDRRGGRSQAEQVHLVPPKLEGADSWWPRRHSQQKVDLRRILSRLTQVCINAHVVGAKPQLLKPTPKKSSIVLRPLTHS